MIKKVFCNTPIIRKIAVFAVSLFVIGSFAAITVFSPSPQSGAVIHAPPFDIIRFPIAQTAAVYNLVTEEPTAQEEPATATLPDANPRVPAAAPLYPHVDTLGFFFLDQIPLSYELQRYIYNRSVQLGLEYELVLALIWRESTFRIEAVGVNRNGTRDTGLMQINDVNREWLNERYGIYNLMDPFQNVDAGTLILADLLSRYSEKYALVAYQFGESGMRRMVRDGADTIALTRQVRSKRDEYRAMRAEVFDTLQNSGADVDDDDSL